MPCPWNLHIILKLFRLAVRRVVPAVRTIFLNVHPPGVVLFVLLSRVIAVLALAASECNHQTILFFCH